MKTAPRSSKSDDRKDRISVAPDATGIHGMTVHWSRKERINEIYRGIFSTYDKFHSFNDVLIWPFGPKPDPNLIALAGSSGNKQFQSKFGIWSKAVFLSWQYKWCWRYLDDKTDCLLVVWNGIKGHRRVLADAAIKRGVPVVYFEEAPLPERITVDFQGVNYGSSLPRDFAFYRAWAEQESIDLKAWRKLGASLIPRAAATREDVLQQDASEDLGKESFIFCPLQVPGDSQITIYGDWISSVEQMIDELAEASKALPDGWHLRIKEHPTAKVSFGEKLAGLTSDKFRVDNSTNTFEQVAASRAVLNINSSVGLQGFFFDKPAIVLGHAFYGIDGIATKASSQSELAELLSAPENLSFDPEKRDLFMSYLASEYYPLEEDAKAGRYTIADAIARDQKRDAIMAQITS
ncbi:MULTISPECIES: capsular biosynthesis protein [Halocynthiibacter]|uniref:Capsular biosynthesis protein n=1 Tax=Halocynthiibacter halioticoli TaxID=2986804 RepID=A0AAE3J0H8_9RHOB|nr:MULTISPECIES: capsular biosynthesis protein [Halocynthiibacter]MCV6825727.1 capsular biosynthesis protein [Halocynthiibacter halioticoli]MCW4058728.1 capsular biosynthesis protein [Halocynthiibacter sp. SDUM655004]